MTSDPWIMIVGAGPNQVPAIELTQDKGFRVFATDQNPDAEGFDIADEGAIASTKNPEKTVEKAVAFAEDHEVEGVMTIAADVSETVSAVAEALDLPGIPREAAHLTTNKARRQERWREAGVPSPRFVTAMSIDEALEAMDERGMDYPVVFKPVDNAGARGVQKVTSKRRLEDAIEELDEYSDDPEFVLEEFLTGTEHSIEGVVVDDEVHWTGFSDRNYDKKEINPPYFLEDGDTLPTALPDETLEEIKQISKDAVRALGVDWGPVKGDIFVSNERGPVVVEMASRMSGDYFTWETVPLHNGTRLLDFVMDLATGRDLDYSLLEPDRNRGVALRYYFPDEEGIIQGIRGVEGVREMEGVHFFRWEPEWRDIEPGMELTLPTSHAERICCVMTHAPSREEAVRLAEKAIENIDIVVE